MAKHDRQDKKPQSPEGGTRLSQLLWANLVFWAFLLAVTGVVYLSSSSPSDDDAIRYVLADTFKFVLLLFGLGFTLVTLFDAAYDFFASRAGEAAGGEKR
jgi:hypothetical protein